MRIIAAVMTWGPTPDFRVIASEPTTSNHATLVFLLIRFQHPPSFLGRDPGKSLAILSTPTVPYDCLFSWVKHHPVHQIKVGFYGFLGAHMTNPGTWVGDTCPMREEAVSILGRPAVVTRFSC